MWWTVFKKSNFIKWLLLKKCRIADKSNKAKLDARNSIEKFFEHLKSKGEINSFEWITKGNKIYSIKFFYDKKPKVASSEISNPTINSPDDNNEKSSTEADTPKNSSANPENFFAQDAQKPHNDKPQKNA